MNTVYINSEGKVFINGQEVEKVVRVSAETEYSGTRVTVSFEADYKSDYLFPNLHKHLDEIPRE